MTFITYDDNTYICQQLGVRLSVSIVSASPIVIFSFPKKMVSSTNRVKGGTFLIYLHKEDVCKYL